MADSVRSTEQGVGGSGSASQRQSDATSDECDLQFLAAMSALRDDRERRMGQLVTTIESEIIPRLLLANRAGLGAIGADFTAAARLPEQIDEFARLLLAHDVTIARTYVETVRAQGETLDNVYLDLLAPAARRLGELWSDDRCTFSEVTVGLCRLHQLLRDLSPDFGGEAAEPTQRRRVLLAPTPGDQHIFGLMMVADFFRREGWDVWSEIADTADQLCEIVSSQWFSVVGLSLGSEVRLDALSGSIHAIRKASRNRSVGVMVGGALFARQPELVTQIGADATALDGRRAPAQAAGVVSMLTCRS
jgi:methanogenic corrinoid protein MtbC1